VPQDVNSFTNFIDSHDIRGIQSVDPTTIKFTLVKPAGDVLTVLAPPSSSATLVEYLNYLPDDANFRQRARGHAAVTVHPEIHLIGWAVGIVANRLGRESDRERHHDLRFRGHATSGMGGTGGELSGMPGTSEVTSPTMCGMTMSRG
jgi:ABC-type transport system substrate-binding protein